jgi:hypothetical protein
VAGIACYVAVVAGAPLGKVRNMQVYGAIPATSSCPSSGRFLTAFGMTPSSRSRLWVSSGSNGLSEFEA